MSHGFGLGLRPIYHKDVLAGRSQADWFEAISENFMGLSDMGGGRPLATLEKVRAMYPVALHGISLSIGSTDPINAEHLRRLKNLVDRIDPIAVSDHFCWTGAHSLNMHDLLPLPYTFEAIEHVVPRIAHVQDTLKRKILLENVSSYVEFKKRDMPEWEFIVEVARRSGCGLLLDVNNIYVASFNHGFLPETYLDAIPADLVGQIHLAGHTRYDNHIVDTHDHPIADPVWALYERAARRFGAVNTMIERDDRFPPFEELEAELVRVRETFAKTLQTQAQACI